ncbi:MAG: Serine/threonine-protein kinase PrkC [candidate division BRC1 bacterium ADurb.BinA364]|nr:MAG: Serine/threonine-protein kinase PrkC [candidate division BRC1 bacterium ADurb.BinA364]
MAQLSHPNVVTIYDIGLLDMRHYIAMELVEGESLSARILREESLPILEAMDIFVQAARGLKAAHDAGVVHRDIKPGNILIGERGDVKIVDFGLARMQYDEDEEEDGKPFCSGTPGFISPEQARGEQALPASDIYALGVTLYYMLTGKPPFDPMEFKDAVGLIQKQAETELPSPRLSRPDTPEAMDRIFSFCAALDPEQRYKSIDEFLEPAENLLRKLQIEQVSI